MVPMQQLETLENNHSRMCEEQQRNSLTVVSVGYTSHTFQQIASPGRVVVVAVVISPLGLIQ